MKHASVLAAVLATASVPAAADPLRLRADALATTASPAGLLVLEADGTLRPGMSAEAVVWMAAQRTPGEDASGDVLVIAVRAKDRRGRAQGQLGRFVSTLGALRPTHLDGGGLRVNLPRRFVAEAIAGMPVPVTGVGNGRSWDWIAGGRIARKLGDYGSVGLAYAQRRDAGQLYSEEVGADVGAQLPRNADLGARAVYDLATAGIAELGLTASHRRRALRSEVYARYRSASHLLPATSLFSVIGDVPAVQSGFVFTYRAAPRLDLIADVAGRKVDDDLAADLVARARLRLDARGKSAITGELRRIGGRYGWTGARGAARLAVSRCIALSTELELVIPDEDRGRGAVWPWGLVAASWEHGDWQAAVAVEASASAEDRHRVDGLLQLSRRWSPR